MNNAMYGIHEMEQSMSYNMLEQRGIKQKGKNVTDREHTYYGFS